MGLREELFAAGQVRMAAYPDQPVWVCWNTLLGLALAEAPEDACAAENLALGAYKDILAARFGDGVREYVDDSFRLLHILMMGNDEALAEFPLDRMTPWREKVGPVFPADAPAWASRGDGSQV